MPLLTESLSQQPGERKTSSQPLSQPLSNWPFFDKGLESEFFAALFFGLEDPDAGQPAGGMPWTRLEFQGHMPQAPRNLFGRMHDINETGLHFLFPWPRPRFSFGIGYSSKTLRASAIRFSNGSLSPASRLASSKDSAEFSLIRSSI